MKGILFGVGETQYQKVGCRDDIDRRAHGPDPPRTGSNHLQVALQAFQSSTDGVYRLYM